MGCGMNKTDGTQASRLSRREAALRQRLGWGGFTLLELMIVITVMMILIAIAVPAYQQHIIRTKETVLKSNLQTLDKVIQQYTLDKGQAPQSLDDLKTAGYMHDLPLDPMTGAADWDTEMEDPTSAADPQQPGIIKVHSHSGGTATDGTAYSTW